MSQSQPKGFAYSLYSVLIIALLLAAQSAASAQTTAAPAQQVATNQNVTSVKPAAPEPSPAKAGDADTEVKERVSALEEALRSQNAKLDEMRRTVAEQQRTIELLSSKSNVELTSAAVVAVEPAAAPQAPALEDRLKKVEGQVLKLGPFRLSGDFRLRADAILRSADSTPPAGFAPVQHQQNVRARYRLRLNFDTDLYPNLSFHGQLATGPINNQLTNDQDFSGVTARHPFFINEAWIDYHPNKSLQLQGGRLQEVFADNSRFLFDDDVRFNGFNEKYALQFKKGPAKITSIELRAGQYILSNPNVAIVTAGSPLAQAGSPIGSTGRSSNLFHQGVLLNQQYNKTWGGQFGGDIQLYRNPNEIQLASTTNGVVLIIQPGLGLTLSGPLAGTGNGTTTLGGAVYTARNFEIARLFYRMSWAGFKEGEHAYPVTLSLQAARNVGVGINERDAMLAALQVGKITRRGDTSYLYVFAIKGANSMISQLTDDDVGTNSGVNIRTSAFRFELGLAKKVTLQSLLFVQRELRNSGQFPNFFVALNAFTPRQYRFQEQLVFTF
jgi:uncharacterized coiled-coil protein SlyX